MKVPKILRTCFFGGASLFSGFVFRVVVNIFFFCFFAENRLIIGSFGKLFSFPK